ncbi:MAG: 3-hydroxyacyl-CoA dehydrogenase/enoyl-CoA hydratase family protein [Alphaproteobacteria bacterium]|nr:3-hydroxyacyl-CoA dehydrogenase/enoyl-CoA hydratase family protein [Alphaproteobacteria bacterium]
MIERIEKVAVIGSGVMGAQIAAHLANAGLSVMLLDIVPDGAKEANIVAKTALEKLVKMDPAPFMHKSFVNRITAANLRDDLNKLGEVDWIIEAIIENPVIKSDLYKKIDAVRKKGSIVSSNTSTIPLGVLTGGQSEDFAADFLITHFFNPPRYMRLLELVTGPKTRADAAALIRKTCDEVLGKGVVECKDTPGFIANRIGTYWMERAVTAAIDLGLSVEEADAVCGKPLNMPKTGVFGLIDLVGLDLMPLIAKSFLATLPTDDAYRTLHRDVPLFSKMIADGYTGRKGKGGFYRINRDPAPDRASDSEARESAAPKKGGKIKESVNLQTGEYAVSKDTKLSALENAGKDLRKLCEGTDKISQFAWTCLRDGLSYAASLVPQIANDVVAVDEAMRFGYNWGDGPFELIDRLGVDWFVDRLKREGARIPELLLKAAGKGFYKTINGKLNYLTIAGEFTPVKRASGILLLSDVKRASEKPVFKTGSASLWDIGDGVLCAEYHSKMNAIDPDIFKTLQEACKIIPSSNGKYKALVIHNEGSNFSVGANLGLALFAINIASWETIEQLVKEGQNTYRQLRYAPFPVVSVMHNMALGGGCEIHLHADHTIAHAETYTGLVEVGVGVIPGWGGCAQLLGRAYHHPKQRKGPMPALAQVFEQIATAKFSKSAFEAREMMYLLDGKHKITFNIDRVLADAKSAALELSKNYKAPEPYSYRLAGPPGKAAIGLSVGAMKAVGKVTPHDEVVIDTLSDILTGGKTNIIKMMSEDDIYKLEFEGFMKLIRTQGTIARIETMLETGKPLRN